MTRFFYTDPLAAAWMAKHFGMRLTYTSDDGEQGEIGPRCLIEAMEWYDRKVEKFYIHPDSLHLLEAKDGDGVEFDSLHWERERKTIKDVPPRPHLAFVRFNGDYKHIVSSGVGWDYVRQCEPFSLPFKIIQRDGVPFMWPESETP